jgi:hypothetical protein
MRPGKLRYDYNMNTNDDALQRTMDKLIAAGWIKGSLAKDIQMPSGQPAQEMAFQWTEKGRDRLLALLTMITEIETPSGPLANDEWPNLKVIAMIVAIQGGSGNPPFRR